MRKLSVALCVMFVFAVGCAGTAPATQKSPLELAKQAYADTSLAYGLAMQTVVDARAAHLLNDAQWSRIAKAQADVELYAPMLRASIDLWDATGQQPSNYQDALARFAAALSEVTAVKAEVKP